MSKVHFVLDLETLSLRPNAAVVEIGLVPLLNQDIPNFHALISPDVYGAEMYHFPFDVDSQTIKYHQDLGPANAYQVAKENGFTGDTAIATAVNLLRNYFFSYVPDPHEVVIWCQGTDFDIPIISNFFREAGMELPWKYHNVRDARTVIQLMHPRSEEKNTGNHRAIADATWTAERILECGVVPR